MYHISGPKSRKFLVIFGGIRGLKPSPCGDEENAELELRVPGERIIFNHELARIFHKGNHRKHGNSQNFAQKKIFVKECSFPILLAQKSR